MTIIQFCDSAFPMARGPLWWLNPTLKSAWSMISQSPGVKNQPRAGVESGCLEVPDPSPDIMPEDIPICSILTSSPATPSNVPCPERQPSRHSPHTPPCFLDFAAPTDG